MRIDPVDTANLVAGLDPVDRRPATPKQAAEQFEQILVKQMVETMTKDLFKGSISGDEAPQWLGAYSDIQSDVLSSELAKQLTANGRLGIAELLLKQWERQADATADTEQTVDQTDDPS